MDLFANRESQTIERLVESYQVLLQAVAEDAARPILELPLLEQRTSRTRCWSNGLPRAESIPRTGVTAPVVRVEQVKRTPDEVAVVYEEQSLTYAQLNRRANQLAHYLREWGVGPDVVVGVCMERSLDLVLGLLGILKAGGAYVPLDPASPPERLQYMLGDAAPGVLLIQARLRAGLPKSDAEVIALDERWEALERQPGDDLDPTTLGLTPHHLAYVIYTSGSTGSPKGVMVEHRNVTRLFAATAAWFNFDTHDVWTLFHSFAFDFSVWELWGALLYGGRVVVVPHRVARSPGEFYRLLCDEGVTVLNQTPSAFSYLIDAQASAPQSRPALRLVIFGGEALEPRSLRGWVERNGVQQPQLVNMYGITETTVHVTYQPLTLQQIESEHRSPIGTAIPDLRIVLLDRNRQVVPKGVVGEMYVGGAGVARGYLNRADLTAERFIRDPFSTDPQARLYKTGDLGRWRADGTLEYLGRNDTQVKIRGFRIELGEIEAQLLRQIPQVERRKTVVVVREYEQRDKRLVAYVIPRDSTDSEAVLEVEDLRAHLKAWLPEYMIPAAFITLEHLPLTANGKLDRAALPSPDASSAQSNPYQAPQGELEEILASIWQSLLQVPKIGRQDNFFESGGHSLLATRVMARIRESFAVELPLRAIFEASTVGALAGRIEQARLGEQGLRLADLRRRAAESVVPLSFAQERLWFLEQLEDLGDTYHITAGLRLSGDLQVAVLERSVRELWLRHESLRTHFQTRDGQGTQIIDSGERWQLEHERLPPLTEVERETQAREALRRYCARPFDLQQGPLFRALLLQVAEQEHVLQIVMHHIVSDGWSLGILIQELGVLYRAYSQGEEPGLPELEVQYGDYALWQRQWLQGAVLDRQLEYWRGQLTGMPAALDLPTDRLRPPTPSYRGAVYPFQVPKVCVEGLVRLARREGATLYMVLLAALQIVLGRWSNQEDVVVGSPIAGRTQRKTEGLIGLFVNTLVMRTDLSGDPTFEELLGRVRERALGAYAHQELPFERLVLELQPQRDLSRQVLFQVMFTLQNVPASELRLPGLRVAAVGGESTTSKFDLEMALSESEAGLLGHVEYATDLFESQTIERLVESYQVLLQAVAADAGQPISRLPLMGAEQWNRVLIEWNATHKEYREDRCVHELVEEQVRRTPGAMAVLLQEQSLTYEELDRRANQLAHYLRAQEVGPDVIVGVCMERSLELVVGLFGVLKAGGAFLPLDPSLPRQRLQFMLEECQPRVVLIQSHLRSLLPATACPICSLDEGWSEIARQPSSDAHATAAGLKSSHLLYVIYTSGSTGRPKGAMNEHVGVVNRLRWMQDTYRLGPEDRVLQRTPISFDVAVWEFFWPLTVGARLVLARPEGHQDLSYLRGLIETTGITTLHFVPSMLQGFLEQHRAGECSSLRHIVCTGEELPGPLQMKCFESLPGVKLSNMYGATETSDDVTVWECRPHDASGRVPIGRPMSNVQMYVLDRKLQPVPIGVVGEIYIGGIAVGRGYLGRPDLTAERFLKNPFIETGPSRLYRTGDLGRWRADGNLEFLGRNDGQVKLHGYRIELGEIEAELLCCEGVREAVVLAREDFQGDKRLVAYYTVAAGEVLDSDAIRTRLAAKLPQYMVPSALVLLEAMPRTPNEKLDRKALPAPDLTARVQGRYVAPATPTEEMLAQIWAEVLRLDQVGVQDNFFESGGHSLLATRVMARVRERFAVELPLRAIFEASTVGLLARRIEQARLEEQGLGIADLARRATGSVVPLSFAQERLWFLEQFQSLGAAYHTPVGLRLSGDLRVAVLERSLRELWLRHESLRTHFQTQGGQGIQIIDSGEQWQLEYARLPPMTEVEQETQVQEALRRHCERPFDLEQGPLFRVLLLQVAEQEHVLQIVMHHIVSDGWSEGILIRELGVLYRAYAQGEEPELPELEVQYGDYAQWQRQWLQGEVLESQLRYWRGQLAGIPAELELPTDRSRAPIPSFRGVWRAFRVHKRCVEGLTHLARREGVTLYMVLLAALQVVLGRWSHQEDVVVGSPVAGRTHRKTEGLIGLFINTLVMRTDLSGDPTFAQVLQRVREMALSAYANQDVPFERLVSELQPQRDLSRQALSQVVFILQNTPIDELRLPGLTVEAVGIEHTSSKFDLTIQLTEDNEGLSGGAEYAIDLFEDQTIQYLIESYQVLLEAVVEDAARPISSLPLMSAGQQDRVLIEWNLTHTEYPRERCVHELFAEQVQRTPGVPAVICEEQSLTYAELDRRANQLAHYLRDQGVGPEVIVGVCMERSLELVVGLLGIWKAGGAYLPLDPGLPERRLELMLSDSGAKLLLVRDERAPQLAQYSGTRVRLDRDASELAHHSVQAPIAGVRPDNLVYAAYTSGSTGVPKAVAAIHAGLVNRLSAQGQIAPFTAGEVYCQKTAIGFMDSLTETLVPLLSGHRLWVAPEAVGRNPPALAELIERGGVTRLITVPSLARAWLEDERNVPRLQSLRSWTLSGEALGVTLLEQLRERLPRCRFLNLYGSTEVAADATCYVADEAVGVGEEGVPIGTPIANARVYVLDEHLQPVPIGAEGEIYVGGLPVARGYLGRGGLTAERFIPDPFGAPGGRLYRSGDRGRYRTDGKLQYRGRGDDQVKVRGFRIELGEVQEQLLRHPRVREAAVLVRADQEGQQQLVAYVAQTGPSSVGQLREHLEQHLPQYMIPGAFVFLERLPLNASGKVDRHSLPAPDLAAQVRERYVAPSTPTEEVLAQIWADVLRLDQVGLQDNFFESGGHSLLATRVMAQVRESFAVELPLRAIFEASTVGALAGRIEQARLGEQGLRLADLRRRAAESVVPLSFAQERLWFLEQLEDLGDAYHIAVGLRLSGDLRVAVLERSVRELWLRHESLRTHFQTQDGQGTQIIDSGERWQLEHERLPPLTGVEREARTREALRRHCKRPFDLQQGPLFRALLLQVVEQEHVLQIVMHHIVSDGWSLGILIQELGVLYRAYSQGEEPGLPELEVQYGDYALWQRQWLQGAVLDRQLEYWRGQLTGMPAALDLPTDRPRPPTPSYRGAVYPFQVPKVCVEGLVRLARREGATLYMVLLAALQIVLGRWSNQEDVVVGSPIAGRTQRKTDSLIGFFVNTLVMRTDLSGDPTLVQFLRRERERALGAYAYQDVPFEKLISELQPQRDLSRQALFQVMLILHNTPMSELRLPGLTWEWVEGEHTSSKFDLAIDLLETEAGLLGHAEYATDLFESQTIERLVESYQVLLQAVAQDAARPILELPLLSSGQRDQVLVEWTATRREYPQDRCVHQLFEEQVKRTPGEVAVVYEEQSLTYAQLNRRANQLAHYLRARQVGPDVLVGVCMERSLDLVLGLLGILKAGGAYVPLDPASPPERLQYMLGDAAPGVLLIQARLRAGLPKSAAEVIALDERWEAIERQPGDDLDPTTLGLTPHHLAYVIYTSGSTGSPKGAMNEHRGVVNRLQWMQEQYRLGREDRVLQKTPFSFDVSVWEFFWTLMSGARLIVARPEGHRDPGYLCALIQRTEVSTVHFVPSMLQSFLDQHRPGECPSLSHIVCSGEELPAALQKKCFQSLPQARLSNLYGPTEAAVDVTVWECRPEDQGTRVPIGHPIANIRMYILDRQHRPVPVGVAGELYIGGVAVARGYLNRPELTAERFTPDPFSTEPQARLYRTGDLGRWRTDGGIEYLGRNDTQVKIRGFRIELGEIEAQLLRHPQVKEAVVVVREYEQRDKRLVAYVIPRDSTDSEAVLEVEDLRAHLKAWLPEYMIPAAFITLEHLPITANGKLDRAALPSPGASSTQSNQYQAPQGELEEILASIWQSLLQVPKIGRQDNFFDVGGNSLLIIPLVHRVNAATQRGLTVMDLFKFPTISELAAYCTSPAAAVASPVRARPGVKQRRDKLKRTAKKALRKRLKPRLDA